MIPDWLLVQAAALLSSNEVNVLFGAMAFIWASLVGACGIIYKIGASWVEKINAKVEAFPEMLRKALEEHEAKDVQRHSEQMAAIQKHADVSAAVSSAVQLDQAVLRERMSAVEDTPHEHHRSIKDRRTK